MDGIEITYKGNLDSTSKFLRAAKQINAFIILDKAGRDGVKALEEATPKNTGLTAKCWYYEIEETKEGYVVRWNNSNLEQGENIALLLQRGHGTRNGGYVVGQDYINPALKGIFDNIAAKAYSELIGGAIRDVFIY